MDYPCDRPQFVRMGGASPAPQGTVLSPVLFTTDFQHNSEACRMQRFSDDTIIEACIKEDKEVEYRQLLQDFVTWYGEQVEEVTSSKYLGVVLDNKLDWNENTLIHKVSDQDVLPAKVGLCEHLHKASQYVLSDGLLYAVVCWCSTSTKAGSVVRLKLAPGEDLAEQQTLSRFRAIMDKVSHPLNETFTQRRSMFSSSVPPRTDSENPLYIEPPDYKRHSPDTRALGFR
ncbi:hypothetical protein WMY93_018096 [Mugilogobius chulae]|uniref:Reverse transcriptase domain-containing protein n=1 Tax=Mugilogobius chulae TaxID=88201 RepID=A0AAW0NTU3_9GOBI